MIPTFARRIRGGVNEVFTRFWSGLFAVAGRLRRPRAASWTPAGGSVLVIAPHPDDETAGCGGALLRHRAAGDPVTVVCLSDGRRSRALGLEPPAMARERRREAERAAAILDVELLWLGLPEGEWRREEGAAALAEALAATLPAVIYAPSRIDFHPEHRLAAAALADALGRVETAAPVRVYPVQVPLTPVVIDRICPLDEHRDALDRALAAHCSQLGSLRRSWRLRRYAARLYRRGTPAEVFWELDAAVYRRLHTRASAPADERFRGLRHDAWSDPLAFLAGRRARRRLRAEAER